MIFKFLNTIFGLFNLKILFLIFGCYLSVNAQLQQEDFNAITIPAGWSATTTDTGCEWQFGYTGSIAGSGFLTPSSFPSGGVIFDDGACGHSNNNNITLTGPEIDLIAEGITSAAIEIIYNHQTFSGDGDFFVDVWNGNDWTTVLHVDDDMPGPNTGLNQTTSIDVSPYINSQFKVKFTWDDENSNQSWGLGIDNYKLENTATVGVDNISNLGFNYYPNPILNDELTLRAKEVISSITVYNTIGELLVSKEPETQQQKINFESFPTGVYIVKVAINNKKETFKVVKK